MTQKLVNNQGPRNLDVSLYPYHTVRAIKRKIQDCCLIKVDLPRAQKKR